MDDGRDDAGGDDGGSGGTGARGGSGEGVPGGADGPGTGGGADTPGHRPAVEEPRLAVRRRPTTAWSRRGFLLVFCPLLAAVLTGVTVLGTSGHALLPFERVVTLEGKMASKRDFFEDEKVRRILLKHHIRIHITSTGSREVAIRDLSSYDFVFPSGQPAGDLITQERARTNEFTTVHRPFVSPIVLATYRAYAEALQGAGMATAHPAPDGGKPLYYSLRTREFLKSIHSGRQWSDIGIQRYGITNTNRILAQSPDVCTANSAGTYLALVAFTWRDGGREVPRTEREAEERARTVKPLMEQGLPHADVFRTYVSPEGKGVAPVVVAYEHQYLTYQARFLAKSGTPDEDRVLLYPDSQFVTQPQFIALNKDGDRLGELITRDPELRRRAMELGFRILDPTGEVAGDQLTRFLERNGIPVPPATDGTRTAMPRLRLLERMISIVGDCPPQEAG
ncbi:hypothetical protein [Streptomyces yaizuensis]|uniref:Substrate-binding domain-containing protein n=1 Tax=Streptomyces yaizuensis TaxID=2989713 RepID=A0ABQ5P5N2_9ACTN|nr:hypothetical protein [Streptomyces sp. YSPA8]GLF97906.1 substrate-binding domain-containing protein [Streptomyces sp. YSPA8]